MDNTFYYWGGIIAAPGYIDPVQYAAGNPYGASHISANGTNPSGETDLAAAEFTGRHLCRDRHRVAGRRDRRIAMSITSLDVPWATHVPEAAHVPVAAVDVLPGLRIR